RHRADVVARERGAERLQPAGDLTRFHYPRDYEKRPALSPVPCNEMNEFRRSISRGDVNELPIRRYEGAVRLIESPEDLKCAMADIRQESVVGLDTETRPVSRKGGHQLPCRAPAATAGAGVPLPPQPP